MPTVGLSGVGEAFPLEVIPLLLGECWHGDRPSGLNRYFASLLLALPDAGVCPRAVVVGPAADAPDTVSPGGTRHGSMPSRIWSFYRAATHQGRAATVVDAHFVLYAFLPVLVGRLRRLPLVVHFHGPWAAESRVQGRNSSIGLTAKALAERMVYRRADQVVVLSHAFKRLLVESYGVSPWRVQVVPPGVDLEVFSLGDSASARRSEGLPEGSPVVVVVRRLVSRMGLDILVRAWANVVEQYPDALLLIAGEGPQRAALEGEADRLGVSSAVRFLGRVSDARLCALYQAADLAVVPTTNLEGFGLVVLEALSCGTPVVATDVGGLPEVLGNLAPDLIVPAGDANALAERLESLLGPEGRPPGRELCREYAASFTWKKVAARHREIYQTAGEPTKPNLRVVYLDHCARLSGGELALLRMLPAMGEVEPHVILAEDGPLVGKLHQAGISAEVVSMPERTRTVPRGSFRASFPVASALPALGYILGLTVRLRRLKPDLVHTNSLKAALYGGVAGRMAGIPVVWHIRDRIAEDYLPAKAVTMVRAAARILPTAIIVNSKSTGATLAGRGSRVRASIPSPIPVDMGRRARSTRDGAAERSLRFGVVGRLAPWKGQHVFLEAFAHAFPNQHTEAAIIGSALFGERTYEQDLLALAESLGISNRVDFRGFRSDIECELSRLDVLVHSSVTPEPFGLSVVEGMAVGLPVIAAAAGGPAESIEDNVTGLLYPPGDFAALAEAMLRLAGDPLMRDRLGFAARASTAQYAPERVAKQVAELYVDVLTRRGKRTMSHQKRGLKRKDFSLMDIRQRPVT